jgi:hypothetical protein
VTKSQIAPIVPMTVDERLERIESRLALLVEKGRVQDWYSIEEFARIVGRSAFTCREWCRNRRIKAEKKRSGRGAHMAWAISDDELQRFRREGLSPPQST